MIIKTFYDNKYHETKAKECDIIKISCKASNGKDKWFAIAEGQLVQRTFKEGSLACGQVSWGVINGSKFQPLVGFSSVGVKVEVL